MSVIKVLWRRKQHEVAGTNIYELALLVAFLFARQCLLKFCKTNFLSARFFLFAHKIKYNTKSASMIERYYAQQLRRSQDLVKLLGKLLNGATVIKDIAFFHLKDKGVLS